jgi:polyisoprenoid-binding protein YceI
MNKLILTIAIFILLSPSIRAQEVVQVRIDSKKSEVQWKGTKMRGLGKHEGVVTIKEGYFETKDDKFLGGEIVFDMNTIRVTDIPKHEPVPRKRLNDHLKSDDFFGVKEFPEAKFSILKVLNRKDQQILAEGELSIRDVTDKVRVLLEVSTQGSNIKAITSTIKFDRFNWNVGYTGSWLDRTLVDKEVEINIVLVPEEEL